MSATTIFKSDPSSSPLSPASSSSCSSSNQQASEEIEMRSSFGEVDARVAAASAAAIAYALELKPKVDLQPSPPLPPPLPPPTASAPPQQKIKKLVRRNASDKLKLIRMVHDNPILWDSRLPNFKGAEEEKNRAWEMIGKEFNAPGRRVARAFKSLRESYRRELAHVKLMGNGFKPKWSLYDAMDFLRDVIRERKGGSHAADHNVTPLGLNLSAFAQHLNGAFSANTNTNNNNNSNVNSNNNNNKLNYKLSNDTFSEAALNLTKCAVAASSLNLNANARGNGNGDSSGGGGGGGSDDYYYHFVKSELDLSQQQQQQLLQHQQQNAGVNITQPQLQTPTINNNNNNNNNNSNNSVNHIPPAHQNSHNDSRVSSTRNDTTQNTNTTNTTTYMDDMDDTSMRSSDETAPSMRHHLVSTNSHQESDEVEELEAIDADFPYPLILNSSQSPAINGGPHVIPHTSKRKRKHFNSNGRTGNIVNGSGNGGGGGGGGDCGENEDDDDDDDDVVGYGGQILQQHRHLRGQNSIGMNAHAQALMAAGMDMLPPPQTVREVLNSKFCGFISAKLNSMEDSEADNLMNKILMLLVQTQTQTQTQTQILTVQTHTSPSTSTSGSSTTTCNSNENK